MDSAIARMATGFVLDGELGDPGHRTFEPMEVGFDYDDYREVLKAVFEHRKETSPQFSYKVLAEILGIDPAGTFRVLNKERHLPARCVSRAIDFLGLTGRGAEYFVLMTSYGRERRKTARQEILKKALELRDVPRRALEEQELSFLRDWWVVAVRCAVEILDGRAVAEEIAGRIVPSVRVEDVKAALDLLVSLGIAKKAQGGRLRIVDQHLTVDGEKGRLAVAEFQRKILELAAESVDRFPREVRDLSTLTITVDERAFEDIRGILKDCRRRIQARVGDVSQPDRALQVAFSIFPLMPAAREGT
jgi:uncharacterized protein (TIGR02147 family)